MQTLSHMLDPPPSNGSIPAPYPRLLYVVSIPVAAFVAGQVFQKGYQVGETLVRPAMVAVAVPP